MSATETKSAQLAHELAPYRAYTRRVLDSLVCEILVMLLVLIYAVRAARAHAPAMAAPHTAHRTPPSVPGHSPTHCGMDHHKDCGRTCDAEQPSRSRR